ncbi:hypothetical protein GCM10022243_58060 [Saccharothrix violaceirubra]|uniref:Uncharacterized protein n=1 Tax=Saccharothrix violaceirubra TaxID=413306 RepID=A0A7W7WWM8_9PSEU|nr:hypothetical protein [Saccharothrix violaceirubra]MBB4965763.1 hypothetical protein [Saccharothrix violaceirubra]
MELFCCFLGKPGGGAECRRRFVGSVHHDAHNVEDLAQRRHTEPPNRTLNDAGTAHRNSVRIPTGTTSDQPRWKVGVDPF